MIFHKKETEKIEIVARPGDSVLVFLLSREGLGHQNVNPDGLVVPREPPCAQAELVIQALGLGLVLLLSCGLV